jgi:hypothetical protein
MGYSIDWSTANVDGSTLSVALSAFPRTPWPDDFDEVMREPVGGVPYSISHAWGPVSLDGETIWVDNVIDSVVDDVKNALDAAVAKANEQFDAYQKQAELDSAARREAAQELADDDRSMTDRFRNS